MVIGIVGISGVGKSYLKKRTIQSVDNLTALFAATTRPKRSSETDGIDKYFISDKEFHEKKSKNEMFLVQEIYGYMYGFLKNDVKKNMNYITEMLYTDIHEMQLYANVKLINIYSNNQDKIFENLKKRYNDFNLIKKRIEKDEIIKCEHELMLTQNKFDFTFENCFDEDSVIRFISLVKEIIESSSSENTIPFL